MHTGLWGGMCSWELRTVQILSTDLCPASALFPSPPRSSLSGLFLFFFLFLLLLDSDFYLPQTLGLTLHMSDSKELNTFLLMFLSSPYFSFLLPYSLLLDSFCSSLYIPLLFSITPPFYPHLNRFHSLKEDSSQQRYGLLSSGRKVVTDLDYYTSIH